MSDDEKMVSCQYICDTSQHRPIPFCQANQLRVKPATPGQEYDNGETNQISVFYGSIYCMLYIGVWQNRMAKFQVSSKLSTKGTYLVFFYLLH